jgi:tRNA-splicing ligase RtcB
MDTSRLTRLDAYQWQIEPAGAMRVPGIIFADRALIEAMDDKVYEQVCNVASLPGIVTASYAMPDAHWGYGFPIGGVAAFDPDEGVISAGGVGFDISCGVRLMLTGITRDDILAVQDRLADGLFAKVPVGLGSTGRLRLSPEEMDEMLSGGAAWAVSQGLGEARDLERIEEGGRMAGARPEAVSDKAKRRQRDEMGTLGSGNHYLEIQEVAEIHDPRVAEVFGLRLHDAVISIHCGSRGLGHQIGTEFLRDMAAADAELGIALPDRELACAPIASALGQRYLGAMRAAINCALANREIIGQLTREVFAEIVPQARLELLFDVSHNTCKRETHEIGGVTRTVYIHRKGATRAFGPEHASLPAALRSVGQPVLIGGSMGTASYVLVGTAAGRRRAFNSACHGAGRKMSRHKAYKLWKGRQVIDQLRSQGIVVRCPSSRGVAEEAPGAYKEVGAVVEAAEHAGLARRVARLHPLVCLKG